jgi:hypothetical protein
MAFTPSRRLLLKSAAAGAPALLASSQAMAAPLGTGAMYIRKSRLAASKA